MRRTNPPHRTPETRCSDGDPEDQAPGQGIRRLFGGMPDPRSYPLMQGPSASRSNPGPGRPLGAHDQRQHPQVPQPGGQSVDDQVQEAMRKALLKKNGKGFSWSLKAPGDSVPASVGGLVLSEAVPAVDGPSLSGLEGDLALLLAVRADGLEEFPGPVVVSVPVASVCHFDFSLRFSRSEPVDRTPLVAP